MSASPPPTAVPGSTPPGAGAGVRSPYPGAKVTQIRVIRSEWTKLRSLRSTVWTLAAAVVLTIGFAAIACAAIAAAWDDLDPIEKLGFDPVAFSLSGSYLAQIAVGSLGVLMISGEYTTGMIRATFSAVPRRLPVLWAKALVFGSLTFVLLLAAVLAAFLVGQQLLASENLDTSLSAPGVVRALLGAAFYMSVIGLLGMALGALFRSTPAAISVLFAMLLIVPLLISLLPDRYGDPISDALPSRAGEAVMRVVSDPDWYSPGTGFFVLVLWAVGSLAVAAVGMARRDA